MRDCPMPLANMTRHPKICAAKSSLGLKKVLSIFWADVAAPRLTILRKLQMRPQKARRARFLKLNKRFASQA